MVYYFFTMSTPFLIAHFLRRKINGHDRYSANNGNLLIYLILIPTMLSLQLGLTIPLTDLIPMPDYIKEMLMELGSLTGLTGFITTVIAAPIFEELIFRGIILDGLLKRYSPLKSILFSSFLFGIVHLNPWQFVSAMIIGCLSGWVYYRTKNLIYSIFIHMVNNFFPFLLMQIYSSEQLMDLKISEMYGGQLEGIIGTICVIMIAFSLIYMLNKKLSLEESSTE